jgi:protein-S-isoprenylcysteine O-methyltransferase Ste14
MYLGVESLLVGEAILFSSWRLLAYAALVGLAFYLFVVLCEERTLRKTFGTAYDDYCKSVPRWIPRSCLGQK